MRGIVITPRAAISPDLGTSRRHSEPLTEHMLSLLEQAGFASCEVMIQTTATKSKLVLEICQHLAADIYLSGPGVTT